MKKKVFYIFVFALMAVTPMSALADGVVYTHEESGVSFTVPEGWHQEDLSEEREYIDVKFLTDDEENLTQIGYGCVDMWDELSASEKQGLTRSEIDNTMFSEADFKYAFGTDTSVSTVHHNGVPYFKIEGIDQTASLGQYSVTAHSTALIYINDAMMYVFMYSWSDKDTRYGDFESFMESVQYPAPISAVASPDTDAAATASLDTDTAPTALPTVSASSQNKDASAASDYLNPGIIIFSLIVTIAIYSLPILIYRYGIRKCPMEPKSAKKLTIIWAIIGFVLMSFIVYAMGGSSAATGGGIFLWSFVNYRMLIGGGNRKGYASPTTSVFQRVLNSNGCLRYQGGMAGDRYEGIGTLYTSHEEVIFSGLFSQGFIVETSEAQVNRLALFKMYCKEPEMREIYRDAEARTAAHIRIYGRVFRLMDGNVPGEYGFLLYYKGDERPEAVLRVNYHMRKADERVDPGQEVIVWGSAESLALYSEASLLVPYIEAWGIEQAKR